ncbi:BapA/Bap/LapF family large adhesin [Acinetobacter thermotolerans]|uniref:BapA/Bap/LapF family large adhesin n=1 Tax=Acinetobacter thermotolerans TaxID=3151487 RepID=UPI00325B85A6
MQVQVISKAGGSNKLIKEYIEAIQIKEESVVLIDVKIEDIEKIEYLDNKAIITLKNGEQIVIDNFNIEESSLVFRNENSELFLFDSETITYNPIDKIEPLLYGHSSSSFISVWPIAGTVVGAVGLAAVGGSGGSGGASNIDSPIVKPTEPNSDTAVRDQLKDVISEAKDIIKDLDGQEKTDVESAIEDAKNVLEDPESSEQDLKDAEQALKEAVKDAQDQEAKEKIAEDSLQAVIDDATEALKDLDGQEKTDVESAIEDAKNVLEDPESSEQDLKDAEQALKEAVKDAQDQEAKEKIAEDSLQAVIDDATEALKDLDGQEKTDVESAIEDAKSVLEDPESSEQDLKDAEQALKEVVEYTLAEAAVEKAEQSYADAIGGLDANEDGFISQAELDNLLDSTAWAKAAEDKAAADKLVQQLADGTAKEELEDRLEALVEPTASDLNEDGEVNETDLILAAEAAVEKAEQSYADAIGGLDANEDGFISQAELDNLLDSTAWAKAAEDKAAADKLVQQLADGTAKEDLEDRLEALVEPTASDLNEDGEVNETDLILAAEAAVEKAEQSYADAIGGLDANEDGFISQAELDNLLDSTAWAKAAEDKAAADKLVQQLADGTAKEELEDRLAALVEPTASDLNEDGEVNETDLILAAEAAVEKAEQSYADAIGGLDANEDGFISQAELDNLLDSTAWAKAAEDKAAADKLVQQLADGTAKEELEDRLEALVEPTASDLNEDGEVNETDLILAAEAAVEKAEQSYADAIGGLDANEDGFISQAELDNLLDSTAWAKAAEDKAAADKLVQQLADGTAKEELEDRLAALVEPTASDLNEDGEVNETDLILAAEAAVEKAEQSYADAIGGLDANEDGFISQAELDNLLDSTAWAKAAEDKAAADKLVQQLADGTAKEELEDRLEALVEPTASDLNDDWQEINSTATLKHNISYEFEEQPSTDYSEKISVLDLGLLGPLLDLDISSGHPLVEFDVSSNTNTVVFNPLVGGVLDLALLNKFVLIVEKQDEYGRWNKYENDGLNVEQGLLRLDLLGLLNTDGTIILNDFESGQYRAALVPNPELLNAGLIEVRSLSVIATDKSELHTLSILNNASGNFIESVSTTEQNDLKVVSVSFKGQEKYPTENEIEILGEFGTLIINQDGSYKYIPNTLAGIGIDTFLINVIDHSNVIKTGILNLGVQLVTGTEEPGIPNSIIQAINDFDIAEVNVKPKSKTIDLHDDKIVVIDIGGAGQAAFESYPIVEFTIKEGDIGFISLAATFGSVLAVGEVAHAQFQKWNEVTRKWESVSSMVDGGLIDLISASGTNVTGSTSINEAGKYRVYSMANNVLTLGAKLTLDVKLTTFDQDVIGGYEVQKAHGNVISDNDSIDATTLVTQVNGQAVTSVEGTAIAGKYGTLVIDVYGQYIYTPNALGSSIGQVDQFKYTIRNALGVTDEATLYIRIDSSEQGLEWSDDQTQTAELTLNATDNESKALITRGYEVTQETTDKVKTASIKNLYTEKTYELSLEFEVQKDTQQTGKLVASSNGTTNSSLVVTIYKDGKKYVEFGKDREDPKNLDESLKNLEAGSYEIKAVYERPTNLYLVDISLSYIPQLTTNLIKVVPDNVIAASGNVLDDDTFSKFTKFKVDIGNGEFVDVVDNTIVNGKYGILTINKDGSYEYQPNLILNNIGNVEIFNYRLEHINGSSSDAVLKINIEKYINNISTIADEADQSVDQLVFATANDDIFTLGLGADVVSVSSLDGSLDIWTDFKIGDTRQTIEGKVNTNYDANADKIDISELLIGYQEGDDLNNYISVSSNDKGQAVIKIDRDGQGDDFHAEDLLVLQNHMVNTELEIAELLNQLLTNQQIIG